MTDWIPLKKVTYEDGAEASYTTVHSWTKIGLLNRRTKQRIYLEPSPRGGRMGVRKAAIDKFWSDLK